VVGLDAAGSRFQRGAALGRQAVEGLLQFVLDSSRSAIDAAVRRSNLLV
jgi:hypothetical protein